MIVEDTLDRLAQGGPVMIPLAAVSLAAFTLIAERWLWIRRQKDSVKRLQSISKKAVAGDLQAALGECRGNGSISMRAARFFLDSLTRAPAQAAPQIAREAALREFGVARRGLALIATLAASAPLLGLLGTVLGMIQTFDAITLHGTGNPRVLAEGISEALLTTQAGLIVALPVLFAHGRLKRKCETAAQRSEEFLARLSSAFTASAAATAGLPGKGARP